MDGRLHLPFDASREIVIAQGWHGPYSHFQHDVEPQNDLSFAVDFSLPIGTVVRAVRGGIVKGVLDSSNEYYTGLDPVLAKRAQANMISIDHLDGTRSAYIHLMAHSIKVRLDQLVSTGQELAQTGMSGWIGPIGPHLHAQLYRYVARDGGRQKMQTIPADFYGYRGSLEHADIAASLGSPICSSVSHEQQAVSY